uniref:Uncharacterized protein n=1 Tax=Ananas comosus var. bracteatus TaxID=296719 RepID=A0A6V7QVQ1_ANACO
MKYLRSRCSFYFSYLSAVAGFIPIVISIIICWIFLVIEALLLAEINISLWKKSENDEREIGEDLEVISLRTMAQETLGEFGGNLATVTYEFLAYTSMVAYASKSGEVLSHLINLPESISGNFFTLFVALLIVAGGTHITDRVNQWLTFSMLATAIASGSSGGANLQTISNWDKVPPTIPVIIFSLVYHDITPAVRTSMIGTLLGVSQFFIEQLINLFSAPPILSPGKIKDDSIDGAVEVKDTHYNAKKLMDNNKLSIVASTIVILPTMLISTVVPNAFSLATDIAGGYCMMILYGILPPMMAWLMHFRMYDTAPQEAKDSTDENKK